MALSGSKALGSSCLLSQEKRTSPWTAAILAPYSIHDGVDVAPDRQIRTANTPSVKPSPFLLGDQLCEVRSPCRANVW
jgi:hypothetical protein